MSQEDTPGMVQTKHRIGTRIRYINMVMLVLSLIVVVSVVSMLLIGVVGNAQESNARFYSVKAAEKLDAYLKRDMALVNLMAESDEITAWFADEDNPEKRAAAYGEIQDYIHIEGDSHIHCGFNASLNEYVLSSSSLKPDFERIGVFDAALDAHGWYYECIRSEHDYTLSVSVDEPSGVPRLFVNYKVKDDTGVLGVIRSGIPLAGLVQEVFGDYDGISARGYVIDRRGVIQMETSIAPEEEGGAARLIRSVIPDPAFHTALDMHLSGIDGYFGANSEPVLLKLSATGMQYISIAPIRDTDWAVITLYSLGPLFSVTRLLPLFIAVVAAFALYTLAHGILMRRLVLAPLDKLTGSISVGDGDIYGRGRGDELGELAKTVQNMRDRLNAYNAELLNTATERDRQQRLLHAVNDTAATLLGADETGSESSLQKSMELMARCMDVDRIYVWRPKKIGDALYYVHQFGWLNDALAADHAIRAKTGYVYLQGISEWEEKFSRGECVNGPVEALSAREQELLLPYEICSTLVVPVSLQDRFWGFVSFDDCRTKRTFTEDEVSILRSGSLMIASAINRREAAAKMHEADERTKLMLDAMPLCCNLWNSDFNNIDCNEAAVSLFGLSSKQEYLSRFFELSPEYQPDGQSSSKKAMLYIREAFETGRVVFEWMHKKLDGTPIPSEITLVRVRHGEEYIVTGYTRDLREHKKMIGEIEHKDTLLHAVNEAAAILLQSELEEFENNLWRSMGLMAGAVGADRVYIWKNHLKNGELYCTQLYEWSEGAAPQQGEDCTIDIPYSQNIPGWEETLSAGRCINGLVREKSPEEQAQLSIQGILSILVVPVFLRDTFWGFVGFDDCHSERVFTNDEETILRSGSLLIANAFLRNEMASDTRAAASKMEAVISNYSGVIWSVDRDNIITLFNGLYLKEMGVTPSCVEGLSLGDAMGCTLPEGIVESVGKTFGHEGPQNWVSEMDGKMFRVHTMPIYDETGGITGVVGSLDDITDTVRLQKALEAAVEEAQAASQAKTNFLSNMSHEMRTPMNAIIGMTMIGKTAADVERKDYAFGKIEDASTHLLGVINDILDMSKIEANRFELNDVEFDFEKLLQKATNVISFRVDEKKQRLLVYLDGNIPPVLIGDDQRLTQVLANLLSNAVKFTPEEGAIRVDAHLVEEDADSCTIKISVTDTGIGISEEQQARLFNSFVQAESSTTRKFGGTGLGLAISRHIVELMGGRIWIESQLGKGSTFALIVRMRRGKGTPPGLLGEHACNEHVRILVVDDEEDTLTYFAGIAAQLHVTCDTAPSGEEALRLIRENGAYDLYFIDWKMPGMDGLALSQRIRQDTAAQSVIIMISASEWDEIEKDARSNGIDEFLQKPLFPSAVAACINKRICPAAAESEAAQPDEVDMFEGCRILLAEDVEINREIVLALLEPTQLSIDCACNGAEAVRMYQETPGGYDMIFMDVQMPEMDGLEATRRIRGLGTENAKRVPIVAMTANVFREDIERCLAAGMNSHVGKPLDFDEVLEKLRQFLPRLSV